jgi:hypothetical protein
MTTFLTFLGSLGPLDWAFILIAWVIVAFALGTFTGLGIALSDRRDARRRARENWDETWADIWPTNDSDDDEVDLRFQQILAAEGLA